MRSWDVQEEGRWAAVPLGRADERTCALKSKSSGPGASQCRAEAATTTQSSLVSRWRVRAGGCGNWLAGPRRMLVLTPLGPPIGQQIATCPLRVWLGGRGLSQAAGTRSEGGSRVEGLFSGAQHSIQQSAFNHGSYCLQLSKTRCAAAAPG